MSEPATAGATPVALDAPPITIVHFSDMHAGSAYFVPNLMERAVMEINEMAPDVVVMTGDLTNDGFRQEYAIAHGYVERIACPRLLVIPGNHDSRNVGYVHFEKLFGRRSCVLHERGISIVGLDSTEPDLDYGTIGRARYEWIREEFAVPAAFRIFMLHHHLLPIPGTGRERNMVYDAADTLEVLLEAGVDLVLCGHKHVPNAWHFESLFVVNAGTVCSLRLRGEIRPCYNIVTIDRDLVRVVRKYPFHGSETLLEFAPATLDYRRFAPGGGRDIGV
jgi:Icc protein